MIRELISELLGTNRPRNEVLEAESRWRIHNEKAYQRGCYCGAPSAVVRYDHRNTGSVPVEFWTCKEHEGVEGWSRGKPLYFHPTPCPAGERLASRGRIGHPHDEFACSHRTHEETT